MFHKKTLMTLIIFGLVLATSIGVSQAFGGHLKGEAKPNFNPEVHEAIKTAIENNDYEAWVEAMGDRPRADKITEENFSQLVEMHNLMQAGEHEQAKEIAEELGIKRPGKKFGKFHRFKDTNGDGFCDRSDLPANDTE